MTSNTATKKAALLTIGAVRFAPSQSALVETLFDPSGTASGIYKKRKYGVLFSKPDGEPFAFLVANPNQSQFFVSAGRQSDGRTVYSFGLSNTDAVRLGLSAMKYSERCGAAECAWKAVSAL